MKVSQAVYIALHNRGNNTEANKEKPNFSYLLKTCGYQVLVATNTSELADISAQVTIFIDFSNTEIDARILNSYLKQLQSRRIVLIGVNRLSASSESIILKSGIAGVFYSHDAIELVVKGIQQIKAGKLWFKRATMETMVQELLPLLKQESLSPKLTQTTASILSKREQSVVNLIQNGAKNQEIADKLHISLNTVKTHIYSIFRKTSCRNRVELIRWSMQTEIAM